MDNICLTCKHRKVLKSAAGYYIGATLEHKPYCRVSGYFTSRELTKSALKNGYEYHDSVENYAVRKGILTCEVNND